MFQANQSFEAVNRIFGVPASYAWLFGVVLAVLVGFVILGGIERIDAATSRIVPLMIALYIGASLFVIVTHVADLPRALALVWQRAFDENAAYGGAVGVAVWGMRHASFSNEAGLGSSAIAHFVYVGSVTNLGAVLDFSDTMILMMAFPNIVGSIVLAPRLRGVVRDYWARQRAAARVG